jgi:hypothetical protein
MSAQTPPGWYPDPSGYPGSRWWDGSTWTEHVGPPAGRPRLPDRVSVSTLFMWILTFTPLIGIATNLVYNPTFRFTDPGSAGAPADVHVRVLELSSVYTPAYFVVQAISLAVYAGSIVLAFLDERALARRGVVRPFAWPWTFLGSVVYVIGRFVVVRKVAPRASLLPLWVFCGLLAAGIVVGVVRAAALLTHIPV